MKSIFLLPRTVQGLVLSIFLSCLALHVSAQQAIWQPTTLDNILEQGYSSPQISARKAAYFSTDFEELYAQILDQGEAFALQLPDETGAPHTFTLVQNTTMSTGLQEAFPELLAYTIISTESRNTWGKMEVSPQGFRAMVFRPGRSTLFVDPVIQFGTADYMAYAKKDFYTDKMAECGVMPGDESYSPSLSKSSTPYNDCELKTYRLSVSATGEYTIYHGGTVAAAMAAIVTTMNRVNGVYERDFGVTMTLIPNNADIVYTNPATDPFTNGNPGAMINENQTNTAIVIGMANLDVGHVFGTNSGGLAGLGVTCNNNNKARGVTGSANPVNDPFDIDYVAHELGHQFGANHSFNNACGGNRNNSTAAEPGSGSTIMAYAGICPANVQNNSDDHFHGINMFEIGVQITNNTCQVNTPIDNVAPQIAPLPAQIFVPASTPFILTAPASDADGDSLTWCWEQMDVAISTQPPVADAPVGPNFRSNSPIPDSSRFFPRLELLAANGPFTWERLSSVSREMDFRVSVRDNAPGAGCTQYDDLTVVTVGSAGPFEVLFPSATGIVWNALSFQTVTWDVANTTAEPINADLVDIYLSTDGGQSYPLLLAEDVANNGSFTVQSPNIGTTTARVMVVNSEGTFFDISNNNFAITAIENGFVFEAETLEATICQGEEFTFEVALTAVGSFPGPIALQVTDQPANASVELSASSANPGDVVVVTVSGTDAAAIGLSDITITGEANGFTNSFSFETTILDGAPEPASPLTPENDALNVSSEATLAWEPNATVGMTYTLQLSSDEGFSDLLVNESGLEVNVFDISGLEPSTNYFWRLRNENECGTSDFSPVFTFTTFECVAGLSPEIPVAIEEGVIASSTQFENPGFIADVNVLNISGTHPSITDLTFRLVSPEGTAVELVSGACGLNVTLASDGDVIVNTPNSIAGTYASSGASGFGPGIPGLGLTANVVVADDGTANGDELCGEAINGDDLDGNIALIYRGNCPFVDKVLNAQNAGAIAVIVVNNVPGSFIPMGGNSNQINIPSVMISQADGNLLVSEAGSDAADFFFSFDDQAATTVLNCPATDGGTYIPSEPLSTFAGENASGTWKLEVLGAAGTEAGSLEGWELQICLNGEVPTDVLEALKGEISAFPNPTNGDLTLNFGDNRFETVYVYDYSGRMVLSRSVNGMSTVNLDMGGIANGLYLLNLVGTQEVHTLRIIKSE